MKKLVLVLCLFASGAHAQVDQEIRSLLSQISRELNQSHDQRTLLRVRERLESTLSLLTDSPNPGPGPLPPSRSSLSCVARDNDGRDPWVLGIKDPVTLQVTKLPSSNIGAFANCERIKPTAVQVGDSIFVCVAKDNDGRDPWTLAHYRNGSLVSKLNNLGSLDQCVQALNSATYNSQAIAFCATRDNDGRAPWIQMSVVADNGQIHRAGSYSSLDQCVSAKVKIKLD